MRTFKHQKLTFQQCEEIRSLVSAGMSRKDAAVRFGVCPSHVSRIVSGQVRAKLVVLPTKEQMARRQTERHKSWRDANRDHVRIVGKLQRHALRAGGKVTEKQWLDICELFDHRCAYCGVKDKLAIEHVTPLSRGGLHDGSNIVPACGSCNYVKANDGPLAMVNRQFSLRVA